MPPTPDIGPYIKRSFSFNVLFFIWSGNGHGSARRLMSWMAKSPQPNSQRTHSYISSINSTNLLLKLNSLCWVSQSRSQTQVLCARCVRCYVSSDCIALFTFCVMRHDSAKRHILGVVHPSGGYDSQIRTRPRFLYNAPTPTFRHPMFTRPEVIVLTNKPTPPKTSNVLR